MGFQDPRIVQAAALTIANAQETANDAEAARAAAVTASSEATAAKNAINAKASGTTLLAAGTHAVANGQVNTGITFVCPSSGRVVVHGRMAGGSTNTFHNCNVSLDGTTFKAISEQVYASTDGTYQRLQGFTIYTGLTSGATYTVHTSSQNGQTGVTTFNWFVEG